MAEGYDFDLIVIGAGPGGYEAAFEAAEKGMKTALVEKDKVGGTCLNRGCIPTKTLMHSAELYRAARESSDIGIEAGDVRIDMDKVIDRKEEVTRTLRDGILATAKKKKVQVFEAAAEVTAAHRVVLRPTDGGEEQTLTAENILVATGSKPFLPPIPGADLPGVLTSDELLDLREKPDALVIIGGGVIGAEFATIFHDIATEVTVIEALDRMLPTMDKELGRGLQMNFKKRGIDVHAGSRVEEIRAEGGKLICCYTEKNEEKEAAGDKILICTGRRPMTEGLFSEELLASAPLLTERGFLAVDADHRTPVEGLYGIGDVTGGIMLAHVATAQGRCAVAVMKGEEPPIRLDVVPGCIYTDPEIAEIGMSQDKAKEAGIPVITKKIPMSANGKTVLEGLDRGIIKLVAREEDHVLIGASLMCGRASDIAAECSLAIASGLTLEQVGAAIHPHPTFAEAVCEAARG